MTITLWVNMINNGDGSVSAKFFNTKERAEASSEWQEKTYGESFCDDVFSINLMLDEDGVLINEDAVDDES